MEKLGPSGTCRWLENSHNLWKKRLLSNRYGSGKLLIK
jgi:hypothetical protein